MYVKDCVLTFYTSFLLVYKRDVKDCVFMTLVQVLDHCIKTQQLFLRIL